MGIPTALLAAAMAVLAGCSPSVDRASSSVPGDDLYGARSDLAGRLLDPAGVPVPDGLVRDGAAAPLTLQVGFGPEHCGWQEVVFLDLAWPLGEQVTVYDEDRVRQFARDVDGVLGERLQGAYIRDVELSPGAADTGYHRQGNRLLVDEASAEDAVYVERPDGSVERWPRVLPPALCA